MSMPREHVPGPWLPVWTLIFAAAEELRRTRAEAERQGQTGTADDASAAAEAGN